ncbi:MAG: phosphoribosyltransferase [Acidimicrobiia bacterium]|nr:phosphoribosyltransferase [Acidimicrobiia bacterium]
MAPDGVFGDFGDRKDAGARLGAELASRGAVPEDAIVCGIPRGGVVVAAEVATALDRPVWAIVARKVGAPGHEELALGAVGPDGVAVLDDELVQLVGASARWVDKAVARARNEIADRVATLPRVIDAATVRGHPVIVVDDGVATGSTAAAVGRWLVAAGATRITLAVPVGAPETIGRLRSEYDEVVVLNAPAGFMAVGQYYRTFTQTTDAEVQALLGT